MKKMIVVHLVRAARKKGGDRYEGVHNGDTFVTYIPQDISRSVGASGLPAKTITVTFETK